MPFASAADRFRSALWFAALGLLIVFAEHAVVALPAFAHRPALPWGVTLDLLVLLPALFYVLVVRRYALPLGTVAGAVGAGLTLAYWLLPVTQQQPLQALRFLPALLEGLTLIALVVKARRLVQHYRRAGALEVGVWARARMAVELVLGRPGAVLVAEIDMLRYAALGWWTATPAGRPGAAVFSNHRESGFPAFIAMAGAVLAVETAAVHLLALHWSATLAYWLLYLDAYALVFCVAYAHAVRLRPTLVTAEDVRVRVGFFWQLAVPCAELVAIEAIREAPAAGADLLNLGGPLFATPNLLLTFAGPVTVAGLYGSRRTARRMALYLDQPQQFIAAVRSCSALPTR